MEQIIVNMAAIRKAGFHIDARNQRAKGDIGEIKAAVSKLDGSFQKPDRYFERR